MPEPKGFHLFDYLNFLGQRKEVLLLVFALAFVLSYLLIFVFVEEQYEATALIIPRTDESASIAGGLLRSMKGLPLGLGAKSARSDMDLYLTIVYSRSMLEEAVRTFRLAEAYGLDTLDAEYMERATRRLKKEIVTKETEESAFLLTVRAGTRERASNLANFLVERLNARIVELNTRRSTDNRQFLAGRVVVIEAQLRAAEDSLRSYQERTGLLDAKSQLQGIIAAHTTLESELAARRIQEGILERMYDASSPQVQEAKMQIDAFEKKLEQMRSRADPGSPLLPLRKLPQAAVEYLRRYREVELNSLLLEYILPLYEQARLEEKKDYPVLQVIDSAVPPAKKSWPPRTLIALLCAVSVTVLVYVVLLVRAAVLRATDRRWLEVLSGFRHWSWPRQASRP